MMKKIKLLITKILSAFLPILFLYSKNEVYVLLHDKGGMDVSKKKGAHEMLLGNSAYK